MCWRHSVEQLFYMGLQCWRLHTQLFIEKFVIVALPKWGDFWLHLLETSKDEQKSNNNYKVEHSAAMVQDNRAFSPYSKSVYDFSYAKSMQKLQMRAIRIKYSEEMRWQSRTQIRHWDGGKKFTWNIPTTPPPSPLLWYSSKLRDTVIFFCTEQQASSLIRSAFIASFTIERLKRDFPPNKHIYYSRTRNTQREKKK